MKVELEKLENYEGIAVKALLDSGATGLFIDTTFAREKGFRIEKMKNPLLVKNVNGTVNIGGVITHQVECNMFFKGHIERVRMDVCNLEKTEMILGMPWLAAHNPEIDWKKGEVKMMWCLPICGKRKKQVEKKAVKKIERNEDKKVLKKLVPKRFWKWKRVFGKKELERIPVQNAWDHAIELKERFIPKKEKVYSLSRKDVKNFIWPYLHQFFNNFHGFNGTRKPLKRPFDRYQSCLEAISDSQDIRQINW